MQLERDDEAHVPELAFLVENGYLDAVEGELKSGKEATVYLGRTPRGLAAVKVYRDREVRSFKSDGRYQAGRHGHDARTARAVAKRSAYGRRAKSAAWAAHEYRMLWRCHRAGVPVPEPLLGPERSEVARSGQVVLMRYVGDEHAAAPRLVDAALDGAQAAAAFERSVHWLTTLWRLGIVHADYSAYNLLWWREEVVVIDLPQAVTARHREARALLTRDVRSLCHSFERHGAHADPHEVLARVLRR